MKYIQNKNSIGTSNNEYNNILAHMLIHILQSKRLKQLHNKINLRIDIHTSNNHQFV